MANKVYIATSLDGYIADENNNLDWLMSFEAPQDAPNLFGEFIESVDAIIMGRNTFEFVVNFGIEAWVYTKPVYVLSTSLKSIPASHENKAFIVSGDIEDVLKELKAKGHEDFYIDGGKTIQSFLAKDLIDSMSITTVPMLLGQGYSLFGKLDSKLLFEHSHTQELYAGLVMNTYIRKRT